jgi:hypothetical protein
MAINASMGRLRWGRALVAAVAVEIVLVALTIGVSSTRADPTQTLNWVIPPACLILFVPAGYWTARGTAAPVLNALLAGVFGILLYVAMTLTAAAAVKDFDLASSARPAYLLAHGLKAAGALIGGWLAARKLAPPDPA